MTQVTIWEWIWAYYRANGKTKRESADMANHFSAVSQAALTDEEELDLIARIEQLYREVGGVR